MPPPVENIRLENENGCHVKEPRKTHVHDAMHGEVIRWKVKNKNCLGKHEVTIEGLAGVVAGLQPVRVGPGETQWITGHVVSNPGNPSGYKYAIYVDGVEDVDPYLIIRPPSFKALRVLLILLGLGGGLIYLGSRRAEISDQQQ